jgi:hypothetical protein
VYNVIRIFQEDSVQKPFGEIDNTGSDRPEHGGDFIVADRFREASLHPSRFRSVEDIPRKLVPLIVDRIGAIYPIHSQNTAT